MSDQSVDISGACLCGAVTVRLRGAPVIVAHCHCRDCQRYSGAGHSTGAVYLASNASVDGSTGSYEQASDQDTCVTRVFCSICASPIYGVNTGSPDLWTFALGLFDDHDALVPQVAIYNCRRKGWDVMDADLHIFDQQPAWQKPED